MSFLLGVGAFIFFFIYIIKSNKYKYHGKYLSYEEYKNKYPHLIGKGTVECFNCGSSKIQSRGLYGAVDTNRTHSCILCGTTLYKTEH